LKLGSTPGVLLKSASLKTTYPPAEIIVPFGMRNLFGVFRSSLKNHPLISAGVPFGLNNSIASTAGSAVCVSTSLITTTGTDTGASSGRGEPPIRELARQFAGLV